MTFTSGYTTFYNRLNMHFSPQAKLLQAKKEVEKFAINDKQV